VDFTRVRVVRVSGAALTCGIEEHNADGVRIRVTSPARTVVDCFKFRNRSASMSPSRRFGLPPPPNGIR
jgi:hypothetical protein